jgi:hypothetical protein
MVMQKRRPRKKCVNAIQNPPKTIQMMFMIVERHPVLEEVSVIFTPKGARPTMANLKHWSPKGMPTIVRHKIRPPIIYSKKINIPPKMIQIRLPSKFILYF